MDPVAQCFQGIAQHYWRIPEPERMLFLRALRTSPCARVREVRAAIWGLDDGASVARLFDETLTPAYIVKLLHDLRVTGGLTARQVRVIERAVLATVDREGQWRAVEE